MTERSWNQRLRQFAIWDDILNERERQEKLRIAGKFRATCATPGPDAMDDPECLAVLGEEVGEVFEEIDLAQNLMCAFGRVLTEGIAGNSERGRTRLRKELIEVLAVGVAWVERLDVAPRTKNPIYDVACPISGCHHTFGHYPEAYDALADHVRERHGTAAHLDNTNK